MKYLFEPNSRIELTKLGFQFYEKDILNCKYSMLGDMTIQIKTEYRNSGFGIVIGTDNGSSLTDSLQKYLFKIGTNTFSCYLSTKKSLVKLKEETTEIEPSRDGSIQTFAFEIKKSTITAYKIYINEFGEQLKDKIGSYTIKQNLNKYYVGIYSNEGNIIHHCSFVSQISDAWTVNSYNIRTGRILFNKNSILMEDCTHNAEIEQSNIFLKKGTYFLTYDKKEVNGKYDIKPYVMLLSTFDEEDEETYHNDTKNILKEGSFFTLKEDSLLLLRFIGTNGQISNISLGKDIAPIFLETKDSAVSTQGSEIAINLSNVLSVSWSTVIKKVPNKSHDEMHKTMYSIIETEKEKYTLDNLNIQLDKKYIFTYRTKDTKLIIQEESTGYKLDELSILPTTMMKIMCNVDALVYNLDIEKDNKKVNLIKNKTIRHYVPSDIKSPILVINSISEQSYDLSASYREVTTMKKKIRYVRSNQPLYVPERLPLNFNNVKFYGVPKGIPIHKKAATVSEFSEIHDLIPETKIKQTAYGIEVDEAIRERYKYFVIEYLSVTDFYYKFTNYEREFFDDDSLVLTLTHPILDSNRDIVVYGIPYGANISMDYLYRVPKEAIQSIDCFTDKYTLLQDSDYVLDVENRRITLNEDVGEFYQYYVIDYLKQNSYAINLNRSLNQYEVDIAAEDPECMVCYDSKDSGELTEHIQTNMKMHDKMYISLKNKED